MATAKKPKKDMNAFRAAHDKAVLIPNKIKAALASLKASGDAWEYEGEFRSRAGVQPSDMAAYRDEFAAHVVQTAGSAGKKVWFHNVEDAKTAREAIS